MGGLHSGRKRKHTCIDDCIVVDLFQLKKMNILRPGRYPMQAQKWTMTNFTKKKEYVYHFQINISPGQLEIRYQTALLETGKLHKHHHTIMTTTTPCNYGGERVWFRAPCCGARVRAIYINPRCGDLEHITPQCRNCLQLHYASQLSSYVERHQTYERHLLTNYGYEWAKWRYDFELKEHYLAVTPDLEMRKSRAQLERQLEMLRLLIRINRVWRRVHQRAIDSLKSEADTITYVRHIIKEYGIGHVQQVVLQLRKPEKREMVQAILADWVARGEKSHAVIDFAAIVEQKREIEAELQALKVA